MDRRSFFTQTLKLAIGAPAALRDQRKPMNRRYFASKLLGAFAVWPWHFRGAPIACAEGKDLCPLGHCQVSEDFLQLPAEPHQRILAEMVASWAKKAKVCTHTG